MGFPRERIESALLQIKFDKLRLALGLTLLLGVVLRLVTLGRQSLWLDESISFWTANLSWAELLDRAASGFRPLFFFFLRPMVLLGGEEWQLRLPSALAGIASLFLLYLIGRELFDRRTGLLAALLLAVSPLHLWYAQEARMYALVCFFVLLALLCALRALRRNRWLDWVLFGLFEGLALWTETAAFWFVLSINLAALLMIGHLYRQRLLGWFAASQALALLIYLPALANLLAMVEGEHTRWIPPATLLTFVRTAAELAGAFMRPGLEGAAVLLFISAALALSWQAMRREAHIRWLAYLLLGVWLVFPPALSFFASQEYFRPDWLEEFLSGRESIFLTRNLITVSFPLLLLTSRSLVLSPFRRLSLGVLVALVLLGIAGYLGNSLLPSKEDYRQAAAITRLGFQPGDLVLASPGYIEQPFAYYFLDPDPPGTSLESLRDGIVSSPAGWQVTTSLDQEDFQAVPLLGAGSHPRLWLVTTSNTFQEADDEVLEYLEQHAELVETWEVPGVQVDLYTFSAVAGGTD